MTKFILLITVLIAGSKTMIYAQSKDTIEADRPGQSEIPFTVAKKRFQIETGFSLAQTGKNTKTFLEPSALLKYGLGNHFEMGVIMEFTTIQSKRTVTGLNPVTFRIKQNITEEKGVLPATSFLGYLTIPNLATGNLKASYYAPAFRFAMHHTLSEKFSLKYNLGAEWDGESPEPTFIYTFSPEYSISDKIDAFAEVYGFVPQSSKAEHNFDCGLSYLISRNILVDISGGAGLTSNAPDYFFAAGFSFRL